jgi:hypothetical protein
MNYELIRIELRINYESSMNIHINELHSIHHVKVMFVVDLKH